MEEQWAVAMTQWINSHCFKLLGMGSDRKWVRDTAEGAWAQVKILVSPLLTVWSYSTLCPQFEDGLMEMSSHGICFSD